MFRRLCSNINSRLVRPLTAFVVAVALSFSCAIPAYAVDPVSIAGLAISGISLAKDVIEVFLNADASEAEKQAALQGYKDHWVTPDVAAFSGSCVLSYEALSQVVLDLNNSGQPARIVKAAISGSADSCYVVQACGPFGYTSTQSAYGFGATSIWNNTGYYYSTANGRVFLAKYDNSLLLQNLYLTVCTVMNKKVNNIAAAVMNSIEPNLNTAVERLTSILDQLTSSTGYLSSLDETLTSVVSEGMVKVDNSAVVSAIQSIPAFDDAAIISAIQSIPAFDDAAIISAIQSIPAFDDRAVIAAIKAIPAYDDTQLRTLVSSLDNYLARINSAVSSTRNDVGGILTYTSEIRDLIDGNILDYMGGMYSSLDYIRVDVKSLAKAYTPYDDTVLKNLVASANTWLKSIATDTYDIRRYTNSAANSAFSIDVQLFALSDTVTSIAADVNEGVGYLRNLCDNLGVSDAPGSSVDLTAVVTSIDNVNASVNSLNTDLSANLNSLVDKLQVVVDNSTSTVENTVINITEDNDAFNVFYIEGNDGNTQSVTKFAGDLTGASGKLLSLLYRLVFADALGGVDGDLDGFEDFFTSQEPVAAMQGMDDTVNEVMDVWAS